MAVKIKSEKDLYTYRVTWSHEDNEYVGLCAEFPSLSWLSDSPESALQGIRDVVGEVILDMQSGNEPIPEPIAIRSYKGVFKLRMPPDVHRSIAIQAAEAKVSINRFINSKLTI